MKSKRINRNYVVFYDGRNFYIETQFAYQQYPGDTVRYAPAFRHLAIVNGQIANKVLWDDVPCGHPRHSALSALVEDEIQRFVTAMLMARKLGHEA